MAYKKIRLLYAADDREALEPILTQLHGKGVRYSEKSGGILLAVLSSNLYNDPEKTGALLNQLSTGAQNILPLQLDSTPIPESIMNALFASNVIPAVGREPEQIAQRIVDALPAPKNPLPKFFIAGALVLAAFIGIFLMPRDDVEEEPIVEQQISLPVDLTQEELEAVRCVVLIGGEFYYFTAEDYTGLTMYEELATGDSEWVPETNDLIFHWYSHRDGSEVQLQEYDLNFLSLMPNLQSLQMVKVKVTDGPDLSGNQYLTDIAIVDCEMDNLDWVVTAPARQLFIRCDVDCSVLTESETLESFTSNDPNPEHRDWSNFSPPNLKQFALVGVSLITDADLSGLTRCTKLDNVSTQNVSYPDMTFLQNATQMEILYITDNDIMDDIYIISDFKNLWNLTIYNCPAIRDVSPIQNCSMLQRIELDGDNAAWKTGQFHDVAFLGQLHELRDITLHNVDLADLAFLNDLSQHQDALTSLWINGTVADWSGLAAFEQYERITLENRITQTGNALPYLGNVQLGYVLLRNFANVDLTNLPNVAGPLRLEDCGIRNLSSISANWTDPTLELLNCYQLSSLDGLESAQWASGTGTLYIYNCPRLTDWSALDGMELNGLSVIGGYTVPDLGTFHAENLRLDSIGGIEDLTFFDNMTADQNCNITLAGLENVNDLRPLERLHGSCLAVPPHLAEQAEDLVEAGNFSAFSIEYPQGGWELDNSEISLFSLDELETLPKALLRRVSRLAIAGDMLVDLDNMQIIESPDNNGGAPQLMVYNRETQEMIPIDPSKGIITDLSLLQELTGLQELQLWGQPLGSIDGIQNFTELRSLTVAHCPNLKDASPAFTLLNLGEMSFRYCPIESIQGIQNIPGLWSLDISCTKVTDLDPLTMCSFSFGIDQAGGISLNLEGLRVKDLSVLTCIDTYTALNVSGLDADLWFTLLEGRQVYELQAAGCFDQMDRGTDINAVIEDLAVSHPELMKLNLSDNLRLTDASALLQLTNLLMLRLSHTMEDAIASLGDGYPFRLNIG